MNKKNMRRPVIETGASEWKSEMLPLHQRRFRQQQDSNLRGLCPIA